MSDLKASVVVDLVGDLQKRADQYAGSLERMGQRGMQSLSRMDRVMNGLSGSLGFVANRFTGLAAAVAGGAAVRRIATIEERFIRLGVQANVSNEDIANLHQRILETAKAPEIRVDPGEITGAIEQIVEKTGDLKFAQDNIRTIGMAIQATGASGTDIGAIIAEFQKMGMTTKEVAGTINLLAAQGKAGAFTLQNLASLGPRVITAYTALGRTGPTAMREMGAALQVIRQGTGSSEMAATAFEALLRTLGDADKVKMLQSGGIQVFDPEALKEGREVIRPINDLMAEIIKVSGAKKTVLSQVFDAEAVRAFNASLGEFQRTGKLASLGQFYNVQAQGNELLEDSTRAARAATAAMNELNAAWEKFANAWVLPVAQAAAGAVTGDKTTIKGGAEAFVRAFGVEPLARGRSNTGAIRQQRLRETAPARLADEMAAFDRQRERMQAELERRGLVEPPQGKVTVEVRAAPGTEARVQSVEGRGIDADSGLIMRGGP